MRIIPVVLQEHELIDVCLSSWMEKFIYHHSHTEIYVQKHVLKQVLSLRNTYPCLFLGVLHHQVLSVAWASLTVGWEEESEKDKTFGLG